MSKPRHQVTVTDIRGEQSFYICSDFDVQATISRLTLENDTNIFLYSRNVIKIEITETT